MSTTKKRYAIRLTAAVLAAGAVLAFPARAGEGIGAGCVVRDECTAPSTPRTSAFAVPPRAVDHAVAARRAECDIRDRCSAPEAMASRVPEFAVTEPLAGAPHRPVTARRPAVCDVRDECTSPSTGAIAGALGRDAEIRLAAPDAVRR